MNTQKIDGITLEVMKNAFYTITEEMGTTLIRTALSTNIKDRMDCSTAIYTPNGELVAQAEHVPLHLGLMPSVVKEVLKIHPVTEMEQGDAILINDPYISGSHLPDVFMISPIMYEGELVAIAANIAHHVDVGGIAPGSMSVKATEIFQEGLRLPGIKIRRKGVVNKEILRLIETNVRTSKEVTGDIYAQLAANNVGEKRIIDLIERYSVEYVSLCMDEIMNYSDRRMRAAIQNVQSGVYEYEDVLEGDGIMEDDLTVKVSVNIQDDSIHVDFTGSAKQTHGPVNSTHGVTSACVFYAIKSLIDKDVPPNEGTYRSITINAPKGTIVNPNFPAPVSNANVNTSQRITDTIFGALAEVLPDESMAACAGTMNAFTIGGYDKERQEYFSYVETYGGGQGALKELDGMDGVHTNMTNTLNTPVEVIEQSFPLLVNKYGLVEGSGGPGKQRGGLGLEREITLLEDDLMITITSDRQKYAPWGLFGGKGGKTSACTLRLPNGKVKELSSKSTFTAPKGSRITLSTAGGGGYSSPLSRDPQLVLQDVIEGNISEEEAFKDYGVIIKDSVLQEEATNVKRREIAESFIIEKG